MKKLLLASALLNFAVANNGFAMEPADNQKNEQKQTNSAEVSEKQKKLQRAKLFGIDPSLIENNDFARAILDDDIESLKKLLSTEDILAIFTNKRVFGYRWKGNLMQFAALCGSANCFKYATLNGVGLDAFLTPYAIAGGNYEICRLIVQKGIDFEGALDRRSIACVSMDLLEWLNANYKIDWNNLIMPACTYGRLEIVKYLVEECKCDVNIKNELGSTPLRIASIDGYLEIVKYLIEECKCDANAKYECGCTLLSDASLGGHLEIVKYLVEEAKCDVNIKDVHGRTPLHTASHLGYLNIVKYLIEECHYDVDARDAHEGTPLHYASQIGRSLRTVKYLIEECKADVEARNDKGFTPLHVASLNGNLKIVKYLIEECKADVEARNDNGSTPLHLASQQGYSDIVEYLTKECHCDVDKDSTPLHVASRTDLVESMMRFIEENRAQLTNISNRLNIPNRFINFTKNDLQEHLDSWDNIFKATEYGNLRALEYFAEEKRIDVNTKDNEGKTLLHIACEKGHLAIVQYLVEEYHVEITDEIIAVAKNAEIRNYLQSKKQ